jgi:tetratricopeptide (TPR) repeat protein
MKRSFLPLILTAFCAQAAVAQSPVALAEQALVAGEAAQALSFAQQVLSQDPDNYAAGIIVALAHADLGQDAAAAQAAEKAYPNAPDSDARLQAARIVANARFKQGQYLRAQWWLRRAANDANAPEESATVAREFVRVRAANPLSINLGFSIAPSDNINNGSTADSFFLEGLDFEFFLPQSSLALSGVEFTGDIFATYDLSTGSAHRTQAQGYLYGRTYALSPEAQDAVPHLSGDDYAMVVAEAAITHSRVLAQGWGPTHASAHAGRTWYGGDPLWDYGRVSLRQDFALGARDRLSVGLSNEKRSARNPVQSDTRIYDLQTSYRHQFVNADTLTVQVSAAEHIAENGSDSFRDFQTSIGYQFSRPIMGARVGLSVGASYKTYDEFPLALYGREDRSLSLGSTLVFDELSYFGFSPLITLTGKRTVSDVTQYTTSQLIARVGVQSTF